MNFDEFISYLILFIITIIIVLFVLTYRDLVHFRNCYVTSFDSVECKKYLNY